jgi:uncharacterized OB-fold protein
MPGHEKPLPDPDDPRTAAFWQGTRDGRLTVQKCVSCGYLRWPPGPICPECQTRGGAWSPIRPTGTLWSVAEYHRALSPAFRDDLPYSVGLIELDDGPRMYGTLLGEPGAFVPGRPVRAVFVESTPEVTLVCWEMQPPNERDERTTGHADHT